MFLASALLCLDLINMNAYSKLYECIQFGDFHFFTIFFLDAAVMRSMESGIWRASWLDFVGINQNIPNGSSYGLFQSMTSGIWQIL